MKINDLIKLIKDDGWFVVSQKGSHIQFKHPLKKGRVTVASHGKNVDVPLGTLNSILKQAGIER